MSSRGPTTKPGQVSELAWSSRFHVHHRIASTPICDHVILCGDAAHVHSPAGGQGMNTGIQDAISLAATLGSGKADTREADLQAWAVERHRVAARVVAMTDRMTRVATMTFPPGRALRNALVSLVGHLPQARHSLARTLAELDT